MSVSYRLAAVEDADALAALGSQTFEATFGHLYDPADLKIFLENHSPECWSRELSDPAFEIRVAEQNGRLIGYVKLGPPHLPFEPRGEAAELRQLYVLEDFKGQGVAHELMRYIQGHGCRPQLRAWKRRRSARRCGKSTDGGRSGHARRSLGERLSDSLS
jgi:diamine N-acetyltransferase